MLSPASADPHAAFNAKAHAGLEDAVIALAPVDIDMGWNGGIFIS
jgi:hypothetical protein